ncbi:MAG: sugar transferase, partial [Lachnospiraceae bacterium]|nr:sugar transferase [Lachnospiraceae bacterium]
RPERPEIIKQYLEIMPEFQYRTKVKAGLAGYAQVYGKYNTTPYDKLKLDLYYIQNYSIWMDIRLAFLTLKILLTPDSTEGVEDSQITAMKKSNEELAERRAQLDKEMRERVEAAQLERFLHEEEVRKAQEEKAAEMASETLEAATRAQLMGDDKRK